ncbi:MAG: hypothetical protein HQ582_25080, partial [Planctomycetes bacterium]|nr:hypothetical protein [Planctomycetota bacterium]
MSANPYESLLRLAAEAPSAVIWATDRELRISECRGGGLKRLNLSPQEEPSGIAVSDLFPGASSDSSSLLAAHQRALAGEAASFEVEWDGQRIGGHVVPRLDGEWRIAGCMGFACEVGSAKQTEHALQAAR